jgi:diguanylate cyclase (GGDEF)-like protein
MTPLRLLQVEDREDDAVLVARELTRAGYDVFSVRVETADGLCRELDQAQWDIVIADYTMPGFSGSKALNLVRDRDLDVPFIFVSGTIGEETAVAAMRTGAQDYIIKGNLTRLAPAVERELRDAAVRRERNLANQRVAYLAYHDLLTDLPNRALLHDRLEQAILRSARDEKGLALLVVDLDGFKEINDAYGHHAGDQVLQEVASRLRGSLRASDTVARLGGDEFAVLLPATDVNRAELAARKVLHDLEHPFTADGRAVIASASIGIAGFPIHASTGQELLQRADAAMYSAKTDRVGYAVYVPERDRRVYENAGLAIALRQAIDAQQFVLDYQPIVHLRAGTTVAIEALVRWDHPERGRLLPSHFMRLAEHTGLVNPLTSFVVGRALADWPVATLPVPCSLAVNVSPRSLHHSAFAGQIRDMLIRYSAPPSMLSLEITESLIMSDPDGSSRSLAELHEMGVRIVIDDFGTGYSSLSYLRRLPVDELKIDRSFVLGLSEGEDDTLVRCLIDLAHNLGLRVVAEGVETLEVCQQLTELGCDAAQGYFISRPGPAEEVAEWITRQRVFCSRAPASGIRVPGPRLLGS